MINYLAMYNCSFEYKKILRYLTVKLILLLFVACEYFNPTAENPIARAGEYYLYYSDITGLVPENTGKQDSTIIVEQHIKKWAQEVLLLKKAKLNLSQKKQDEYETLVSQYKKDLYINAYQEALVTKTLEAEISQEELQLFYEEHNDNFVLNEKLLKIQYLHISDDNSQLKRLRQAFRRFNENDEEYLYSEALNFKSYSFNETVWVKASDVIHKLPKLTEKNQWKYFRNRHFFEVKDSTGVYFVKINKVIQPNQIAPFDYVAPKIEKIILNKRRRTFIKNLERELINEAIQKKEFQIFSEK